MKYKFPRFSDKADGILNYSDFKRVGIKIFYFVMMLFLVIGVIVTLYPIVWLVFAGFKEPLELQSSGAQIFPSNLNFSKIIDVWNMCDLGSHYLNSIILVVGAIICSVLFNGLLAFVISILKPAGSKWINLVIMASLMIPSITSVGILFHNISSLGLTNSFLPLWLSYGANAYYYVMFKTYFDSFPVSLFEAAKLDGANKIQIFTRLVIPLSRPIIAVVAIFTLNAAWSDFLLPYLVLKEANQPLMVYLYTINSLVDKTVLFTQDKFILLLMLAIVPAIIFFIIFQKQISSNVTTEGMKE